MYLLPDRSLASKRKTSVKTESLNPTWNETFSFAGFPRIDLEDRMLLATLYDRQPFAEKVRRAPLSNALSV